MKFPILLALILTVILIGKDLNGQGVNPANEVLPRLILEKNFKDAVSLGSKLISLDSLNPQTYYQLGVAYSNLKQYRKACNAFERSDSLQPGNKSLLINLADCYCEMANPSAAEFIIKKLIETDSSDTYLWLQMALVYQRQSKSEEAGKVYSKLWEADSMNIWYPRQIGLLLLRSEKFKEAVPYLEVVVEADSADQGSYLRLGQAYINLKSSEKIPVMDKAIRQDSLQPLLYRYRGGLFLGAGFFEPAKSDFKRALALGDTSAFTCRHLGISQFQLSEYKDALWSFSKTVEIDSMDSEAWYHLGFCYKWTEDIPKGIECLNRALKIAIPPSAGSIYSGLGLFYNLQRNLKKSMVFYEKALEYNPDNAYPYSQLGLLVEQTSRDKMLAKSYYEQYIRNYKGEDQHLFDYVNERLQIVNEKLFMEGKIKKK